MIMKFVGEIKYRLNPPKKGDIYYGDPLYFVIGRPVEYVLHELVDKNGDHVFNIVPSPECYRMTLDKLMPDYYVLTAEVFCTSPDSFLWKSRIQPRRIKREQFKELVIDKHLRKEVI